MMTRDNLLASSIDINMRIVWVATVILLASITISVGQAPVYPVNTGLVDVTLPPYNADPTGVLDATDAINQAFLDNNDAHSIIYLPAGTYRITNTIMWGSPPGCESGSTYTCHRYTILAGAGRDETILKLDDNHPDYQDPNQPKLMVWTQTSAAMSFENAVRNLTINTGIGNPGTHALGFEANNQGGIQNVKIISEDGQGKIGLHMGTGDQAGPCFIRDLEVDGFDWGVYTFANQNSIYFERLTLRNQNEYGFYNRQQSVGIRKLFSENEVTAIYNHKDGGSIVTLIDSELIGIGSADEEVGFLNNNRREIFLRNVEFSGYEYALQQIQNGFSLELLDNQLIEEYTTNPPKRICDNLPLSLNLPIKELPVVQYRDTSDWASVVDFGATIDGGFQGQGSSQDDTQAFQDAMDAGDSTVFVPGPGAPFPQRFIVYDTIEIPSHVTHFIGGKGLVSGNPVFKIMPGTDTLIIEDFAQLRNIYHYSDRVVFIKNCGIKQYEANPNGSSGDVFIEDVVGGPYYFYGQDVWARQLNVEKDSLNILNDGGSLWILGMKTEKKGTAVRTVNGGKTEILGSLFYGNKVDETIPKPIFEVVESSFSISGFKELEYINDAWDIKVRETRNGETNDYTIGNSTIRADLFTSYVSTMANVAPTIDAGSDQIILLPADSTQFYPEANDDGLPSGDCYAQVKWTQLSGPSSFSFEDDNKLDTKAYFSESGEYLLSVAYDDGALTDTDTIVLSVYDHYSSTEDHDQDSIGSGYGADANLRGWSNYLKNYGGTTSFGPRNYNQFPAKSIFRIDVSAFDTLPKESARLELELATTNGGVIDDWTYNVFGLNDGDAGEDWIEGNLTGQESPADEVNYDNAPGFSAPFGGEYDPANPTSGGVDHTKATFLGTIKTRKGIREKVSLSSDALRDFVNADTSGSVTFLFTRESFALNTIVFASKEHETFAPPTLYFNDCNRNATVYVDQTASGSGEGDSWENAMITLEAVFDSPCWQEIDTILIAEGTYIPNTQDQGFTYHIDKEITILGSYASGGGTVDYELHPTIISGNINDQNSVSDNILTILNIQGPNGILTIDGVRLEE